MSGDSGPDPWTEQPPTVSGLIDPRPLRRGGFGAVYRAWQVGVGREVALKVDSRVLSDQRDRRRFLREASAAGRLSSHTHIVPVYDAGVTEDGRPYLVMELCRRGSLVDRVREDGPLRPEEVRAIGVGIADALATAHAAGVLHRDVKPGNILLDEYGVAKLADFGLAAVLDASGDSSATREALTPAYAAPEAFAFARPTSLMDVYGLAATLYALLAGRPPRTPSWPPASLAELTTGLRAPVPPVPGVHPDLFAVLVRALDPEPASRTPSAAALRDQLSELPSAAAGPPGPPDLAGRSEGSAASASATLPSLIGPAVLGDGADAASADDASVQQASRAVAEAGAGEASSAEAGEGRPGVAEAGEASGAAAGGASAAWADVADASEAGVAEAGVAEAGEAGVAEAGEAGLAGATASAYGGGAGAGAEAGAAEAGVAGESSVADAGTARAGAADAKASEAGGGWPVGGEAVDRGPGGGAVGGARAVEAGVAGVGSGRARRPVRSRRDRSGVGAGRARGPGRARRDRLAVVAAPLVVVAIVALTVLLLHRRDSAHEPAAAGTTAPPVTGTARPTPTPTPTALGSSRPARPPAGRPGGAPAGPSTGPPGGPHASHGPTATPTDRPADPPTTAPGSGPNGTGLPPTLVACAGGDPLCPATATCWDVVVHVGSSQSAPPPEGCSQPHRVEAYAAGRLPQNGNANPVIAHACTPSRMRARASRDIKGWKRDVQQLLIPRYGWFFYCVAAPKDGSAVTGPSFSTGP
jgi:hypothetical protein